MGAIVEVPCKECGMPMIAKAGEENVHAGCRLARELEDQPPQPPPPKDTRDGKMPPPRTIIGADGTAHSFPREEILAGLHGPKEQLREARAGVIGRDAFGDTEDLGAMMSARDRLLQAQAGAGRHAIAATLKEAGLKISGAIGMLSVALIAAAIIAGPCGGN